jgi:hypothetical protein
MVCKLDTGPLLATIKYGLNVRNVETLAELFGILKRTYLNICGFLFFLLLLPAHS